MKATEEGENREGGRIRDEEEVGERWRDREEHNEHVGVNVTKRVTNLSKNICVSSFTSLRFIEVERTVVMLYVTSHWFFPCGLNG